jgi:hypothetical protein
MIKGRTPREFKVGEHLFLKVKEKKFPLKLRSYTKIEARCYCSFEIVDRIEPIAYMLALFTSMQVNNVFHLSLLKNYVHFINHVIG